MPTGSGQLPSLNALRVFEVVSRHLNFRLAAEELDVTQGAVAQQIRGLEADLGIRLFERGPRMLTLTDAGRLYAGSIRRVFELIVEATQALRPEPQHLTISVTPAFASKWLIPRLPSFMAAHPDIDLRILATDRLSSFQAESVDLAVRYGRPPFGPALNAELLFGHRLIAVASPETIERLGWPNAGNLQHHILLHDAHNFWPQFLALGSEGMAAKEMPRGIRFNQTGLAIESAVAGHGLALVNPRFVVDDMAAGRLARVLASELVVEAAFYIVAPRRPKTEGPLSEVWDWLLGQVV